MDTGTQLGLVKMVIRTRVEWCWLRQTVEKVEFDMDGEGKNPVREANGPGTIASERLTFLKEQARPYQVEKFAGGVARPLDEAIAKPPSSSYQESRIIGSKGR